MKTETALVEGPDLRTFLLRKVLERFGHGDLRSSPYPARASAMAAAQSDSAGSLLRSVCDIWSIPLGELARTAGVDQTLVSSFVMGVSGVSPAQAIALSDAVSRTVLERAAEAVPAPRTGAKCG